jgi:DNA polymerase-1
MEPSQTKRLVILDCNSILHRAYHALPPLTTSKGEHTGAIYGFLLVLFRVLREFQPDYVAAAFDFPAPSFRHKVFREYKAKRPLIPLELSAQIAKTKELLPVFGIPVFEKAGFEADDIIGTIVRLASHQQAYPALHIIIVSGDGDALQLIDTHTEVYFLKRGVKDALLYNKESVRASFEMEPSQLLDFKALRGDPSDNIPGVTGIGEKTARELIKIFGTLENLYRQLEEKTSLAKSLRSKIRELLLQYKDQAFLSRELASINKDVEIPFQLAQCRWGNYSKEKAREMLRSLEFYSLIEKVPNKNSP